MQVSKNEYTTLIMKIQNKKKRKQKKTIVYHCLIYLVYQKNNEIYSNHIILTSPIRHIINWKTIFDKHKYLKLKKQI